MQKPDADRFENDFASIMERTRRAISKTCLRWKLRKVFGGLGYSFIASNCIGGRFSQILGEQYLSPTVGLWFAPSDFLRFVENLHANLASDPVMDDKASAIHGCPVGIINDIRIVFLHYPNFEVALQRWNARRKRVAADKIVLISSDRDGATYEQMKQFDALPFERKILFTHKPYPELRSAVVIEERNGSEHVGELYSRWHLLNAALPMRLLKKMST
ncbi:MAG TPA: DUF1919 domain-containing protein [Rhodocyclaceae bacterium]|nr:DUF1919 domain-containing protein [Rhodocyclaceae bacterium]